MLSESEMNATGLNVNQFVILVFWNPVLRHMWIIRFITASICKH